MLKVNNKDTNKFRIPFWRKCSHKLSSKIYRDLNKKEIQLNLCFDIFCLIFNDYFDIPFIRLMTFNRVKLGCAFTLMKYLANAVSLIFLRKTLIWNKIMCPASNSVNFALLVQNQLMKSISKIFTNIQFYIQLIGAYSKVFKIL